MFIVLSMYDRGLMCVLVCRGSNITDPWCVIQVFCGHQDLSNVDPPDYGVNLLHDDEDRTPHELDHTSPVNGTSLPWSLDDIRFIAFFSK